MTLSTLRIDLDHSGRNRVLCQNSNEYDILLVLLLSRAVDDDYFYHVEDGPVGPEMSACEVPVCCCRWLQADRYSVAGEAANTTGSDLDFKSEL